MSLTQENKVLFKFGTFSNYTALAEKDAGTLYFIDNGQLYLGDQLIGSTYEYGDYSDKWPEQPVSGRLYVNKVSGEIRDYSGNKWNTILKPTSYLVETTYSDLVNLRDNNKLVPGIQYRITDYVTTTAAENTRSAGHVFDIIVTATSENSLSEDAKASLHKDDTYFAISNLDAWQLKYCLDNDTYRFDWADITNGKGVIYYMKDEFNNECPYDFKNIQFMIGAKSNAGTIADIYYYTFSVATGTNDANVIDHSLNVAFGVYCYDNSFKEYITSSKQSLNFIVCRNTFPMAHCHGNSTRINCNNIACGNSCYGWSCGHNCYGWSCGHNCFGWSCGNYCQDWSCGGDSYSWSCGNDCSYWTCGNYCQDWSCGNACNYWEFGSSTAVKNYYKCIMIDDGCSYFYLDTTQTTSYSNYVQNIHICQGIVGEYDAYKTITVDTVNNDYQIRVENGSDGNLNIYNLPDELDKKLEDAPIDSKQYARCNGQWTEVEAGGRVRYLNVTLTPNNVPLLSAEQLEYLRTTGMTNEEAFILRVKRDSSVTIPRRIYFFVDVKIAGAGEYLFYFLDAVSHRFIVYDLDGDDVSYWFEEFFPEAPSDNKQYVRKNGAWAEVEAGISELVVETTYSALKSLRDAGNLISGTQYRITDYVTTTATSNTSSAGHVFDIIVTADDTNTLNEDAKAIRHEGDTYFANSNLDAWELKYCLDNDANRFAWADTANGKGVIYYMKDEFGNEAHYDFSNILFDGKYTFNYTQSSTHQDARYVAGALAHDNIIGPHYSGFITPTQHDEIYILSLNNIILQASTSVLIYNNIFGKECSNISMSGAYIIGNIFKGSIFDCTFTGLTVYTTIDEYVYESSFESLTNSMIESDCYYIQVKKSANDTFTRCHVVSGTQGTNNSTLIINATSQMQSYGINSNGVLDSWNEADHVNYGKSQSLTTAQQTQARTNIGAGDVSGSDTLTANQVIVGNGSKQIKALSAGTDGTVLSMKNGKPEWYDLKSDIEGEITDAIEALDSTIDVTSFGYVITGITQTDGKLTAKTEAELSLVQSTMPSITSYQEWQLKLGTSQIGSNIVIPKNSTITRTQIGHALDTLNSDGTIASVTSGTDNYDALHIVYYNPETNTYSKVSADISSLTTGNAVTLNELATPTDGYLKTYQISQGGNAIGTIDIPKDFLIKSGSVKTVTVADTPYTGAKVDDKYIDFVINVKEGSAADQHIYIPVNDLVDVYTVAQNATQIQLAISATNEISATIVAGSVGTTELANGAVTTAKIADANVTEAKLDTNLQNKIDGAVQTVKVNGTALTEDSNNAVNITVTSGAQNGTISVNGTDVAVNGLQSAAFTEVEDNVNGIVAGTTSEKLTTSKQVAEFVNASLLRWGIIPGPRQLTFTANEDNSGVGFCCWSDDAIEVVDMGKNIQYSTDGGVNWYDYEIGLGEDNVVMIDLNEGDSVMFKGINENLAYYWEDYGDYLYTKCIIEGSVAASGDVTSLLNGVGGDIALAVHCFDAMFLNCAGLTTAPSLPSMTLAENCYGYMFYSCTGLTTAPALPATTLAKHCYTNMFYDCTELTSIEVHHTSWLPDNATNRWLKNVSTNGTFRCPSALPQTRGMSNIPNNWAIETF